MAAVLPECPKGKADFLSSESRVNNSILSVLHGCCVLMLFLRLDPALVVYHSPVSTIAVRTHVTEGDGRTAVLTIVITEFTTSFYFGIRRLTNFFQYRIEKSLQPCILDRNFSWTPRRYVTIEAPDGSTSPSTGSSTCSVVMFGKSFFS